eukprot:m51a1_g7015 putative C-tail anchored protein (373) ;mRNA; f:13157-14275
MSDLPAPPSVAQCPPPSPPAPLCAPGPVAAPSALARPPSPPSTGESPVDDRSATPPRPRCWRCSRDITGRSVEALGRRYHEHCFVCRTCGNRVGPRDFLAVDGDLFCPAHGRSAHAAHRRSVSCASALLQVPRVPPSSSPSPSSSSSSSSSSSTALLTGGASDPQGDRATSPAFHAPAGAADEQPRAVDDGDVTRSAGDGEGAARQPQCNDNCKPEPCASVAVDDGQREAVDADADAAQHTQQQQQQQQWQRSNDGEDNAASGQRRRKKGPSIVIPIIGRSPPQGLNALAPIATGQDPFETLRLLRERVAELERLVRAADDAHAALQRELDEERRRARASGDATWRLKVAVGGLASALVAVGAVHLAFLWRR